MLKHIPEQNFRRFQGQLQESSEWSRYRRALRGQLRASQQTKCGWMKDISVILPQFVSDTPEKRKERKKKRKKERKNKGNLKITMILKFPPVRSAFPISSPAALRLLTSSRPGVSRTKLPPPQSTGFDKTVSPSTIATPLSKYCPTFPVRRMAWRVARVLLPLPGFPTKI